MRRRPTLALAAAAAIALSSSPARAEPRPGEWYGYQVLLTDVFGVGLFSGGLNVESWQATAIGAGSVLFGGPIVHAAHGNWGRAGISLGLRVGLPAAGGALLGLSARNRRSYVPIAGVLVGVALGYLAAAAVDIAIVAQEPDEAAAAPRVFSIGGRF